MDISFIYVLAVLGLGVATLWSAVPVGIVLGLDPWIVGVAAAAGAGLGTALVLALGERLRSKPPAALVKTAARPRGLMSRAWVSHGAAGLGLLAPLVVGAPLGAAMGIFLGASPGRLAFWLMLGIVLWSVGLTWVATFGLGLLLGSTETGTSS